MPQSDRMVNTCGREAVAVPAQTRSAAADSGNHERWLHAQVLGEAGGRRVGVFTRQQSGIQHGIPQSLEHNLKKSKPGVRMSSCRTSIVSPASGSTNRVSISIASTASPRLPIQLTNEPPLAARIPQTLDAARRDRPLGESLVIDVVTRYGIRLRRMRGGNPAKAVEGDRFSH